MGKWMDLAARLEAEAISEDNRDNRDESPPNVPNVPFVPQSLPASISEGLQALAIMAAPRLVHPERWPAVIADAVRLAGEGWASQALGLGWDPLEIWGCCPFAAGDPAADGLAVWLQGRRILLLDSNSCIVASEGGGRDIFSRRHNDGSTLIWNLAKGATRDQPAE